MDPQPYNTEESVVKILIGRVEDLEKALAEKNSETEYLRGRIKVLENMAREHLINSTVVAQPKFVAPRKDMAKLEKLAKEEKSIRARRHPNARICDVPGCPFVAKTGALGRHFITHHKGQPVSTGTLISHLPDDDFRRLLVRSHATFAK